MVSNRPLENFHYKLIREHPTLEIWGHLAASDEDALHFFAKKLGVRLELCASPGSYRLEKYVTDPSGKVLHDNILRISYVKQA